MHEVLSTLMEILGAIFNISKTVIELQPKQESKAQQELRNKKSLRARERSLSNDFTDGTQAKEEGKGNAYFEEGIECCSKSIDELPTAAAYSNRAIAYFELNKFTEAEKDCTEALKIDDRYFEAYAHRAMARKNCSRNLKGALRDVEAALELEPNSQEMKDLCSELDLMLG